MVPTTRVHMGLIVLLVLAAGAIMCGPAWAATITVSADGTHDYTTIQEGVNVAEGGDTIEVYPGNYDESVTVNKALTFRAVKGPLLAKVIGSGNGFTLSGSGRIRIEGFTIIKANDAIVSSAPCDIYNCILTGQNGYGFSATQRISNTYSLVNCLIAFCGKDGVSSSEPCCTSYATLSVRNCIVLENTGAGVRNSSSSVVSDFNCYWTNQGGNRVSVTKGTHDVDTDPLFRDADNQDFRLQESPASPCINAGDNSPGSVDPDGTRNDIGLFGGPFCASFWYGPLTGPAVRDLVANPPAVQYGNSFRVEGVAEIR